MIIDYKFERKINYNPDIDKKWQLLQCVYKFAIMNEFVKNFIKIYENNGICHSIRQDMSFEEFLLYTYPLDIKSATLRGTNADCTFEAETGDVILTYFDRRQDEAMQSIISYLDKITFAPVPAFSLSSYFFIPNRDTAFYKQLISFIYYLSEIDVAKNGIKILNSEGRIVSYKSLNLPEGSLADFIYYDGNIFIGSHSKSDMIIVHNLPKNKFLELRRWCNEYEG